MIYLSGPTDDDKAGRYKEQYINAENYLKHAVFAYEDNNVFNSYTEFCMNTKCNSIKKELLERITIISKCEKIYFLIGWEKDLIARAEHEFAKAIGLRVIYSKKF